MRLIVKVVVVRQHAPSWEEWRAEGQDSGSLLADPMLEWSAAPRLGGALVPTPAKDSPVWALGFQPIDVDNIGPRRHSRTINHAGDGIHV